MTNDINNATDVTTTDVTTTTAVTETKRTWKEAAWAALAGLRARLPEVTAMRVGVTAFIIALCVSGAVSISAVRQIAAAETAREQASAAYLKAAAAKLVTPAPAPEVGYDGQVAAWARARLDFSAKK
jgi:hypothetical protein